MTRPKRDSLSLLRDLSRCRFDTASRQDTVTQILAVLDTYHHACARFGFFGIDAGSPGAPYCLGGTALPEGIALHLAELLGVSPTAHSTPPHWSLTIAGATATAWLLLPPTDGDSGLVWLAGPCRGYQTTCEVAASWLAGMLGSAQKQRRLESAGRVTGRPTDQEYERIIESIPQLLWRTNLDGSADYVSVRFARHLGYARDAMMGWGWTEIIHAEDKPRVLNAWAAARARDGSVIVDFRAQMGNGQYRWFLSMGSPYRDATGRSCKYYGTWTDIEDNKQASLERERLLGELQKAVQARDDFLSIASHELKTPLTPLKMQVQRLGRLMAGAAAGPPPALDLRRMAATCDDHIARLTRLIDDLLDITQVAGGMFHLQREPCNLNEVVRDICSRHATQAQDAGCHLVLDLVDGVQGNWDRSRLTQVLANLLLNAVKYAPGKPICLRSRREGDVAVLSVEDHGCGIAAADIDRVFERFERVAPRTKVGGLGLGLYITKQIVQAHGGEVRVASQVGEGSTFIVSLPMACA